MSDDTRARDIAARFTPGRCPTRVEPLGSGHIHETLRVVYEDGDGDLVLQRVNETVFPDLAAVMHNLIMVTQHLRDRGANGRAVLEVLSPPDGAPLVRDAGGAPWRAFRYLDATHAYDAAPDDGLARAQPVKKGEPGPL